MQPRRKLSSMRCKSPATSMTFDLSMVWIATCLGFDTSKPVISGRTVVKPCQGTTGAIVPMG